LISSDRTGRAVELPKPIMMWRAPVARGISE
jgi:hypothetical protein